MGGEGSVRPPNIRQIALVSGLFPMLRWLKFGGQVSCLPKIDFGVGEASKRRQMLAMGAPQKARNPWENG